MTGDGSFSNPFLTIAAAMSSIVDASAAKRYVINLGPGSYSTSFVLKPWIWIVGAAGIPTRDVAVGVVLDPAWGTPGDQRGGFTNLTFTVAQTFDFNAVASNEGKIDFRGCAFNVAPTFVAFSAINQILLDTCRFFAGYAQIGINMTVANCFFQNAGPISLTSINDGRNVQTILQAFGGGTDGDLNATWTASAGSNGISVNLLAFAVQGHVTLDGASISYTTGSEGLPKPANLTLLNAAPAPVQVTG